MNLKLRPIDEAPLGKALLVVRRGAFSGRDCRDVEFAPVAENLQYAGRAVGFYLLDDLLKAAEILDKITPEGFEYTGEFRQPSKGEHVIFEGGVFEVGRQGAFGCKYPILRRIQPPVEYRYETDGQMRKPLVDEWVLDDEDGKKVWKQLDAKVHGCVAGFLAPCLCYTRREVQK